jgi:hypothetical protein
MRREAAKEMDTTKRFKISWITIWLAAAAVAFSGVVGYAAYTRVTTVKRVVSTRAGAGVLFTSNYMSNSQKSPFSIEYGEYKDYLDSDGEPLDTNPTYTMTVCNYSQGDKATWYVANDIKYQIKATLWLNEKYTAAEVGENTELIGTYKEPSSSDLGSLKFGIKYDDDDEYSYFTSSDLTITLPDTGNYILNKTAASSDVFSLLFDKSELKSNAPNFLIEVEAIPISISGGEIEAIHGYVGTCQSAEEGAKWSGYIEDIDYESTDYDSYNYIITGNGKGTFYFAWDDSKVKPNEFAFLNYTNNIDSTTKPAINVPSGEWEHYVQYGKTAPSTGTWKYIKMNVDSDGLARYEFQLYKTSGTVYQNDNLITKYVDYYFVAD